MSVLAGFNAADHRTQGAADHRLVGVSLQPNSLESMIDFFYCASGITLVLYWEVKIVSQTDA